MDNRPIALFDSGLGGLTVLQKLKELMPNENFIYFGDTARVPYGSKSKETIINYSKEITSFLEKQTAKLIIIACGTASSLAYEELLKNFKTPIMNVIAPTTKNIKSKSVGVIATKATIKSKAWETALKKRHKSINVISKACPLFVPIVEESLANSPLADEVIDLYLADFKKKPIDSLILGCTHYPILIEKIKSYLGKKVNVININEYCAKEAKSLLKENHMEAKANKNPSLVAFVTDDVSGFKKNANIFCNKKFDKV
jgi:glutamate racemase